ncbi:MAG TPA: helix-turn-helix domain-containing protein [Bacilli bacterium]|nr:helix-turn-helix domain-containing protein [Bacilli bacterium]
MAELGQRLRRRRLELGWTQGEAAQGVCSPALLSMIEGGRAKPSAGTLRRLAERLCVPLPELVQGARPELTARVRFQLGQSYLAEGDWQSAEQWFREIEEAAVAEIGRYEWEVAQARVLALAGRFELACLLLEDLYEQASLLQNRERMYRIVWLMGELAEAARRTEVAEHQYRRAHRLFEQGLTPSVEQEVALYAALARTVRRNGREEEAHEWVQVARWRREACGSAADERVRLRDLAELALEEGRVEQAARLVEEAETEAELARRQKRRAEEHRLFAAHLLRQGDAQAALPWYEAAMQETDIADDLPWAAQLLGEMTACLQLTGSREAALALWTEWSSPIQRFFLKGHHQEHAGHPPAQ